jgi:hypothetical protein
MSPWFNFWQKKIPIRPLVLPQAHVQCIVQKVWKVVKVCSQSFFFVWEKYENLFFFYSDFIFSEISVFSFLIDFIMMCYSKKNIKYQLRFFFHISFSVFQLCEQTFTTFQTFCTIHCTCACGETNERIGFFFCQKWNQGLILSKN